MDDLTLVTRKDAANREMQCDVQLPENHKISERNCTTASSSVNSSAPFKKLFCMTRTFHSECRSYESELLAIESKGKDNFQHT
jgi:hypothetical protein